MSEESQDKDEIILVNPTREQLENQVTKIGSDEMIIRNFIDIIERLDRLEKVVEIMEKRLISTGQLSGFKSAWRIWKGR